MIFYGGNTNDQCSAKKSHMIQVSSGNTAFSCSIWRLIRGKHLSLAFTIKSSSESKTMVSLLNQFDHWASGETVR